jgi:toxin HigB-1
LVIRSFEDKATETVFGGESPKGFPNQIFKVARRKLEMVNAAATLSDLRVPPANGLEALTKDRAGQHSTRINDKFRICFRWTDQGPEDVEVCDYH